jgi:hypothetical protein
MFELKYTFLFPPSTSSSSLTRMMQQLLAGDLSAVCVAGAKWRRVAARLT